jgi:hypothetical protein
MGSRHRKLSGNRHVTEVIRRCASYRPGGLCSALGEPGKPAAARCMRGGNVCPIYRPSYGQTLPARKPAARLAPHL